MAQRTSLDLLVRHLVNCLQRWMGDFSSGKHCLGEGTIGQVEIEVRPSEEEDKDQLCSSHHSFVLLAGPLSRNLKLSSTVPHHRYFQRNLRRDRHSQLPLRHLRYKW